MPLLTDVADTHMLSASNTYHFLLACHSVYEISSAHISLWQLDPIQLNPLHLRHSTFLQHNNISQHIETGVKKEIRSN